MSTTAGRASSTQGQVFDGLPSLCILLEGKMTSCANSGTYQPDLGIDLTARARQQVEEGDKMEYV